VRLKLRRLHWHLLSSRRSLHVIPAPTPRREWRRAHSNPSPPSATATSTRKPLAGSFGSPNDSEPTAHLTHQGHVTAAPLLPPGSPNPYPLAAPLTQTGKPKSSVAHQALHRQGMPGPCSAPPPHGIGLGTQRRNALSTVSGNVDNELHRLGFAPTPVDTSTPSPGSGTIAGGLTTASRRPSTRLIRRHAGNSLPTRRAPLCRYLRTQLVSAVDDKRKTWD